MTTPAWVQLPESIVADLRRRGGAVEPGTKVYQREADDHGHLSVLVSHTASGWHLSISHRSNLLDAHGQNPPGRYPTWDEIAEARYRFCPDHVTMAMLLPPRAEYVNVMPTTFHLWELHEGEVAK